LFALTSEISEEENIAHGKDISSSSSVSTHADRDLVSGNYYFPTVRREPGGVPETGAWPTPTIFFVHKFVCQWPMDSRRQRELAMGWLRTR
jgi:hypothetical protein